MATSKLNETGLAQVWEKACETFAFKRDAQLEPGISIGDSLSKLDENISNEIDRATNKEDEIESALNSEITRAKNAESTLETNKVPITRTINGKALSSDITLSASDVGADASGSANTALTNAKAYTDTKVADLVGTAPETLDTLEELADALKDNADIVDVLNESITSKASAVDLTSHASNNTVHITADERAAWNAQGENIELLEEEVNGIEIGGRNYCRNNSYWKSNNTAVMTITNNDDGSVTITKNGSGQAIHCYIPLSKTLEVGETYTLTVKYKMTSTLDTCGLWTYNYNTLNSINNGEVNGVELYATDDYVVESTTLSIITKENCNSLFVTSSALVVGDTIDIAWIKVEKGNKSTDWTPNPDDDINATTATKLETVRTINDTDFDGSANIRIANSYNFKFSSVAAQRYFIFAKLPVWNPSTNEGATLLVTDTSNFANPCVGTYIVQIANRSGGNSVPNMYVRQLVEGDEKSKFGYYIADEYIYFGVYCPQWSAGVFVTVLSKRQYTEIGTLQTLTTKPDTWVEISNGYTPQANASDTVAGKGKLYTETGSNTDGSMTQSAITTALGGKASKYEWTATVKGQTWSRIFQVKTSVSVIGNSGILNVSFTRGNVVCNATFMITTSHKNKCFITQLSANSYSPFKIRGVANTHGDAYIELYDYTASISTDTEQAVYCRFIPLRVNTVNVYTEFVDGTTVPTDYTANDPLTVDITGGSMVASKFVGDLAGNATTATKLATARTINDTDFDGSADIRTKTSYNLKFGQQYANNGQYRIFAKLPKVNTTGNQGCTLLVTDVADCGRTHNGAWIVQCTNRGTTPTATMQVRSLLANHSDVKFGYYSDDDYFYFGLMNPAYSAGTFITVLSKRENNNSEDKTTIGCLSITPTKPSDWTVVETKYTPQPSASDTVAGIMKLYTGTGSNTDGTMTQDAITTALDDKFGATVSRTANTVLAAPNGSAGGASFRKLVADDIPRLKNSWNFSFSVSGGTVDYRTFAKILKTDTNNSGATLLITDGGNYGNTHVGAWIVHITNRGGNPSMHVRALETSSNIVFGFWSNDDYYYFGAKCEKYSAGLFCTVLSSRGSTTIGKITTSSTQPSNWTEVDFLYTPQPSASTSTAGIGKLYTATGTGTDGSMTQSAITTELGKYLPLAGGTVNYLNISNIAKAKSLLLYLDDGATTVTGMYHSATNEVIYSSTGLNKAYSSHILKIGSSSGSMYGSGTHFDLDTQIRGRYIALEATKAISSSVSIVTSSDEKVKSFTDDIETDEEKLVELFDIIKPKSYNYKYSKADSLSIGFSAQEIEQAMIDLDIDPEKYGILNIQYGHMLSRGDDEEDGKYYTKFYEISYNDLFNLSLLKMHVMEKEHVERLNSLEARLSALENK